MTFTFSMTVTNSDGTVVKGAASDADVMRSLATAARRGYTVEVTGRGTAHVTREIPGKGRHVVTYEPFTAVRNLTRTVLGDLRLIATRKAAVLDPDAGRINAGYINSIPPAASALLVSRGLVRVDGTTVTLSAPARIAMLALAHCPAPWGYVVPAGELAGFLLTAKGA